MARLPRLLARMARAPGAGGTGPIGCELAPDRLSLVQLERRGDQVEIRAQGSVECPEGRDALRKESAKLAQRVRAARQGQPFRGRRIVTVMPDEEVKLMLLNYRLEGQRSEPEQILKLVGERVEGALADCVVDYLPIRASGESQAERSALVAVARREGVLGWLELWRRTGLTVDALEIGPVAVRRLATRLAIQNAKENVVALHTGRTRSDMTVLWGRRLILYREVDFSETAAVSRLSETLDMSPESAAAILQQYGVAPRPEQGGEPVAGPRAEEIGEAIREILKADLQRLAEAVNNALVYTASRTRGGSIDDVYLIGCAGSWPGVARLLEELVSRPVAVLDPRVGIGSPPVDAATHGQVSAIAAGLALRGVSDEH